MRVLLSSDELAAGIDRLATEVRAVVGGEGGPQPAVLNACTVKR
jgi:hypothetical protein